MFLKSRAGRANLDTKLPNPFAWLLVIMFVLPAMYPHSIIPKHSIRAGRSLSTDMLDEGAVEFGPSWVYEQLVALPSSSIVPCPPPVYAAVPGKWSKSSLQSRCDSKSGGTQSKEGLGPSEFKRTRRFTMNLRSPWCCGASSSLTCQHVHGR